jgi:2-oxoglutarate dehydrogenase E2 component (dihydrolipoamide succinyltransferase)
MSVKEIKVPSVGESVSEVTLSEWLVEDGDYVELDQAICEFESDKATLELPSEAAGKITFKVEEGADLEIGDVVAEIDTEAEGGKGDEDSDEDQDKDQDKDQDQDEGAEDKRKEEEEKEEKEDKEASYAEGHASPAAAKLMREHDLSEEEIEGTGKDGRIIKEDVQNAIERKEDDKDKDKDKDEDKDKNKGAEDKGKEEEKKEEKKAEKPDFESKEFSRDTHKEKMSRMRRTIARRLVSAKNETAMLTTFNEVDLTEIKKLRKKYQEKFVEKYDIKLGFMSLFAKACSNVLMEMKNVNAILEDDHLIYHDYVDISIAISTDNGLVVPPVNNVESLSLAEIEWEIKELADKARKGTLSLKEMQGGTFTITNGGIFGSVMSTPILNEPQSAILGMHTIQERPVAIDGEVEIRPMMYLALSYDHRVIDGSSAVTFLVKVKELLQDPIRLLLDV